MSLAARVACLAGFAGLSVAVFSAFSGGGDVSPPERVTSDTPAYCQLLLERVHELARNVADLPRREASGLADEGRRLCDGGEIRAGLLRLRHAVMLIMDTDHHQR
jgi:hypothetical protein